MLTNTCPGCGKDRTSITSPCPSCGFIFKDLSGGERQEKKGSTVFSTFISIVLVIIIAAIIAPNFQRTSHPAPFTACQSNCKNIGTALEMYSDHQGHYPQYLQELTPAYMKNIPTCQAAGSDTYSAVYRSSQNPDVFTFYCNGSYHSHMVQENYPQYNSKQGLVSGK